MQNKEMVLPSEGFVRLKTVLKFFPVGESSWYRGVKEGKYPKPVSLGAHTSAYKVEDIRNLIKEYQFQDNTICG